MIVGIIVILGAIAVFFGFKQKTNTISETGSVFTDSNRFEANITDPKEVLRRSYIETPKVKNIRSVKSASDKPGDTVGHETEISSFVRKDREWTGKNGTVTTEKLIVYEKEIITEYIKDVPNNTWWKETRPNDYPESFNEFLGVIEPGNQDHSLSLTPTPTDTDVSIKLAGIEKCPNEKSLTCYTIELESLYTIYIDTKDFLTRYSIMYKPANREQTITEEYQYENIKVDIPKDAKEVPDTVRLQDFWKPTVDFL